MSESVLFSLNNFILKSKLQSEARVIVTFFFFIEFKKKNQKKNPERSDYYQFFPTIQRFNEMCNMNITVCVYEMYIIIYLYYYIKVID